MLLRGAVHAVRARRYDITGGWFEAIVLSLHLNGECLHQVSGVDSTRRPRVARGLDRSHRRCVWAWYTVGCVLLRRCRHRGACSLFLFLFLFLAWLGR